MVVNEILQVQGSSLMLFESLDFCGLARVLSLSIAQVAAATAAGAAVHRGAVRRPEEEEEGALETVVAALEEALDPWFLQKPWVRLSSPFNYLWTSKDLWVVTILQLKLRTWKAHQSQVVPTGWKLTKGSVYHSMKNSMTFGMVTTWYYTKEE